MAGELMTPEQVAASVLEKWKARAGASSNIPFEGTLRTMIVGEMGVAIADERERCAKIADDWTRETCGREVAAAARAIVAAIRDAT